MLGAHILLITEIKEAYEETKQGRTEQEVTRLYVFSFYSHFAQHQNQWTIRFKNKPFLLPILGILLRLTEKFRKCLFQARRPYFLWKL